MIKKILIVGATIHGANAVSGIMEGIIREAPDSCDIHCFGFVEKNKSQKQNYLIANPYEGYSPLALIYRLKRKCFHLLKWDCALLTTAYVYWALKKVTKDLKFDLVIGVSGRFCYMEAAYLFARKHHITLKLVYFDPFTLNIHTQNKRMREQVEAKWLSYAGQVYYNAENELPAEGLLKQKAIPFYIPIFLRSLQNLSLNKTLVYGGTFYQNVRTPDGLYALAEALKGTDWQIECYSNLRQPPRKSNIRFAPLLPRKEFDCICKQAGALIYVGNCGGNSRSSKYLEYIGYRKPIIGIQVSPEDDARRYKYYFDVGDKDLIDKLNEVNPEELKNYNPVKDFPERNPRQLAENLFA